MSTAAKALIVTWVMIGLIVAGGVGFYLGRVTIPKGQNQSPFGIQSKEGITDDRQPRENLGPPKGSNQGPNASGIGSGSPAPRREGQENPSVGTPPPVK